MKRPRRTLSGPERAERVVELLALRLLELASRGLLDPDDDAAAVPPQSYRAKLSSGEERRHGAR